MGQRFWLIVLFVIWTLCLRSQTLFAEECFLLMDGLTGEKVCEWGPIDTQRSPCSTFKIPLSLMGFDAEVLKDANHPVWDFQEGYDAFLEAWKAPQSPQSWINYSCVWYSKILAEQIGLKRLQNYLALFAYGNQDLSVGLIQPGPKDPAWNNSSLKISPRQQAGFLQKMVLESLPVSKRAVLKTKELLFREELPGGWKLYGKRGLGDPEIGEDGKLSELGWFVGWVEQSHDFFPFAYLIREEKLDYRLIAPRINQLLQESVASRDEIFIYKY